MPKNLNSLPSPMRIVPSVSTPSTSHNKSLTRARLANSELFARISAVDGAESDEVREQVCHVSQRDHIRAVAERAIWIRVRFDEEAVRARNHGATRQHRRKLALAGRFVAATPRQLDGM